MNFEEKMPPSLRQKILHQGRQVLNENRISRRKTITAWLFGGLSLAAAASFGFFILKTSVRNSENNFLISDMDLFEAVETAEDFDILADLDVLEELEVLENYDSWG